MTQKEETVALDQLVDKLTEIQDLLEYHLGLSPLDDIVEQAKEMLDDELEKLQEEIE